MSCSISWHFHFQKHTPLKHTPEPVSFVFILLWSPLRSSENFRETLFKASRPTSVSDRAKWFQSFTIVVWDLNNIKDISVCLTCQCFTHTVRARSSRRLCKGSNPVRLVGWPRPTEDRRMSACVRILVPSWRLIFLLTINLFFGIVFIYYRYEDTYKWHFTGVISFWYRGRFTNLLKCISAQFTRKWNSRSLSNFGIK